MPRRVMQGTVVSDKMDKTVVVKVERRVMHPIYKKYLRQSKRYLAHDEGNVARIGDVVRIRECRPLSKRKCWEIYADPETERGSGGEPAAAVADAGETVE